MLKDHQNEMMSFIDKRGMGNYSVIENKSIPISPNNQLTPSMSAVKKVKIKRGARFGNESGSVSNPKSSYIDLQPVEDIRDAKINNFIKKEIKLKLPIISPQKNLSKKFNLK